MDNQQNNYSKYIKYKTKYLNYKNMRGGNNLQYHFFTLPTTFDEQFMQKINNSASYITSHKYLLNHDGYQFILTKEGEDFSISLFQLKKVY